LSGLSVGNWSFGCTIQLLFQVNSLAFDQISHVSLLVEIHCQDTPHSFLQFFLLVPYSAQISMSLSLGSTLWTIWCWAINIWKWSFVLQTSTYYFALIVSISISKIFSSKINQFHILKTSSSRTYLRIRQYVQLVPLTQKNSWKTRTA
jgi:hypothetical protein